LTIFGMSIIHEIAKNPEFKDKLRNQLSGAFENRLDEIIDRIASLDDFFFIRKEYDIYLDEARWSYFYGYFIAAINLSCVCAERLLIDFIMEASIRVNEHLLSTEEKENAFSGQLQSKRIKFAYSVNLIKDDTFKSFQKLDNYRHKYIHPNKPIAQYNISEDSKDAISKLHKIIKSCFPMMIEPTEKERLKQEIIDRFVRDEIYRDRKEPHSSSLPHHAAYGSELRGSADQASSTPGERKPK